jgi:large subunit ribosomal protein L31
MKKEIHPTYFPEAKVTCACGESWMVGSTKEEIRVDICSNCHPFFTGEQRIVDTEGQVDRFYKRLEARQQGQFLEKLAEGEEKVLAIDGFGRKSLADVKKALRRLGYKLPEEEVEAEA